MPDITTVYPISEIETYEEILFIPEESIIKPEINYTLIDNIVNHKKEALHIQANKDLQITNNNNNNKGGHCIWSKKTVLSFENIDRYNAVPVYKIGNKSDYGLIDVLLAIVQGVVLGVLVFIFFSLISVILRQNNLL